MDIKTITVGNKNIVVMDNVFDYGFVLDIEIHANNSFFKMVGSDFNDGRMSTYTGNYNLCSLYSKEDVAATNILTKNEYIAKLINGREPTNIKLHLLRPFDICAPHVDGTCDTFLYYVNVKWDVTFGGQTMFFTDDMADVAYTSLFTPNRVVWLDGSIPHMGTPPTAAAKHPRLVLAMQFLKD